MTAAAHPRIHTTTASVWAGRAASTLVALFLTMDAISHLLKPQPVVAAFAQLGLPLALSVPIGLLALACVALYVIPRTALLGAVLLTGYLGGATAIQARAGSAAFPTVFPAIVGTLAWGALTLRNRVRL
jgi:DoxX-like family